MKILIPTDFSSFSDSAIKMGIKIAQITNSDIHLFHALDQIKRIDELSLGRELHLQLQEHVHDWASDKINSLADKIRESNIECSVTIVEDKYLAGIENIIEADDYDLIIIGSHGVSGKEEWFLGSNASKTVRKLHNNILVVKSDPETIDFSEVVYVTGLDDREKIAFKSFLKMMKLLSVKKIHILTIDTSSYFSEPTIVMIEALKDFKQLVSDIDVETHFYPDFSVHSGIRHFSEEHTISLIGISNVLRHPIKRIFQGSNVESIVNHSNIPVLTIDQNKS